MNRNASEEDILAVFVEEMESRGENRKLVRLDIDESMLERINKRKGSKVGLEHLHKYADRCLANEWLEHTVMGVEKYGQLSITTTGLGVVRSRQRKEEALANHTSFKKFSGYIESHKGFFGIAERLFCAGLCHHECLPPSRKRSHPWLRRYLRSSFLFIWRFSLPCIHYRQRSMRPDG